MCQEQEKAYSDLVKAEDARVREKQLEIKLPGTLRQAGTLQSHSGFKELFRIGTFRLYSRSWNWKGTW